MRRMRAGEWIVLLAVGLCWVVARGAAPHAASSAEMLRRSSSPTPGELGDLLGRWWKEGTAAGNVGDYYDNRDREHSGLDMRSYPQLQKIRYTPEELKRRADWALQPR